MDRFNRVFSAFILSFGIMFGTASLAQAAPATQQGKMMKVLTLPQQADILNRMAIHNAIKGDARKAAHFFLRSFHTSRKAKDKKRAIRAIANLKKLERKFGKAAILKRKSPAKKAPKIEAETPLKPYNMPSWRVSKEA